MSETDNHYTYMESRGSPRTTEWWPTVYTIPRGARPINGPCNVPFSLNYFSWRLSNYCGHLRTSWSLLTSMFLVSQIGLRLSRPFVTMGIVCTWKCYKRCRLLAPRYHERHNSWSTMAWDTLSLMLLFLRERLFVLLLNTANIWVVRYSF
jgi:hypothetical protein